MSMSHFLFTSESVTEGHPDKIADNTTVKDTARRPTGIEKVMSNGQWVVENGRYVQGIKPGRVVRYSS